MAAKTFNTIHNIRVSGIPEAVGETWEVSEAKVKAVIKEKLQIDVDIERAHRVEPVSYTHLTLPTKLEV